MLKRNILFVALLTTLVIPFSVHASDVELEGTKKKINDYVCDEVKNHELYIARYRDTGLVIHDDTDNKDFLLNFNNIGVCGEFIDDDGDDYDYDDLYYEYRWDNNNLYADAYDSEYYGNALTNDEIIEPGSSYDELINNEFVGVLNPVSENLSKYYEGYSFDKATDDFDIGETYYRLVKIGSELETTYFEKIVLDETTYVSGEYYVLAEPVSSEKVLTLSPGSFVAPKEKTGLTSDYQSTREDFILDFTLGNKKIFVFSLPTNDGYQYSFFDENGKYQSFGYDNVIVNDIMTNDIGDDYVSIRAYVDGVDNLVLLDTELNNVGKYILDDSIQLLYFLEGVDDTIYYEIDFNGGILEIKIPNYISSTAYDLTFDANGGKFKDGKSTMEIADWTFSMIYTQEEPTRDGYTFKGWYVDKELKTPLLAEPSMTNVTTIYAKWEESSSSGGAGTVEPEIENPKTFDGIGTSIFMGTISLIGLAGATIYLRKKNKVRAN